MNSITYLDALLTRSLSGTPTHSRSASRSASRNASRTASRKGSVGSAPAGGGLQPLTSSKSGSDVASSISSGTLDAALQDERDKLQVAEEVLGNITPTSSTTHTPQASPKITRRASDYSLRRGERERRLDALGTLVSPGSSFGESIEASETPEHAATALERISRAQRQSASEGGPTLRRAVSAAITATTRPAPPARWAALWGLPLGGWFDASPPASARIAGPTRRASSGSLRLGRWRAELELEAELRAGLDEVGMSQAEAEDVVDFEGGEPESEDDNPHAPPTTPAAGLLHYHRGRSTSGSSSGSGGSSSLYMTRREGSGTERLGSFLFGALASRVDDYFGPQPTRPPTRSPTPPSPLSRKAELVPAEPLSEKAAQEASSLPPDQPAMIDATSLTESGAPGSDKLIPLSEPLPKHVEAGEGTPLLASADPPPPYTPAPATPPIASPPLSALRRAIVSLQRALQALRRALVALLLLPFRLLGLMRQEKQALPPVPYEARQIEAPGVADRQEPESIIASTSASSDESSEKGSLRFAASASDSPRGARATGEARRPLTPGVKPTREAEASGSASSLEDTDSGAEEPATDDAATARLARRAERKKRRDAAALAAGTPSPVVKPPTPRSSKLLPNPHPFDILSVREVEKAKRAGREHRALQLGIDVEKASAASAAAAGEKERSVTLMARTTSAQSGASIPRGPASRVIHHTPKVLVLDLDETLIHSTSRSPTWSALRAGAGASGRRQAVSSGGNLLGLEGLGSMMGLGERGVRPHQVEVILDGRSVIYHVYKRPYVDYFLRKVASWYHVIIFTASVQEYADPVIDWLDQGRGLIGGRMFREACTFRNGSYLKDLAQVDSDLSRVCLVDNSPASYIINPANGIPIEGWTHDPNDECLLDLLPVLDALRFASDVRNVLSIRGF